MTQWTNERLHAALNGQATPEEARLIAAAPEMAELLERIAANPHTEEWTRQRSEARALLARTKGE